MYRKIINSPRFLLVMATSNTTPRVSTLCHGLVFKQLPSSWATAATDCLWPMPQKYWSIRNSVSEVGTTFLSQNSSADHLTLIPFESKFFIFVPYFNASILLCNLVRSIIGLRRTVRDHFSVQAGCRQKLLRMKYMKSFGILFLCYEFGWSLAGLQARCQMGRGKMARNTRL